MVRFVVLGGLAALVWKMASGRWPWEPKPATRAQGVFRARKLLGVSGTASREEILIAHRQHLVLVHPDRGGTNEQVHEANAARDLLLDQLPDT